MNAWQLKLPLKEITDFTANERQTDAEKEVPSLNVTEQLTCMGTTDGSVVAASFSAECSIQAKVQNSHASYIGYITSLVSRLLCPS